MTSIWRLAISAALLILAVTTDIASAEPFRRSLYKHWIDVDGDCQDTREEVLIAESTVPVTLDRRGCKVRKGRWFDPYTGRTFTNPKKLDIDHFIPLKEVHRSGGSRWGAAVGEITPMTSVTPGRSSRCHQAPIVPKVTKIPPNGCLRTKNFTVSMSEPGFP